MCSIRIQSISCGQNLARRSWVILSGVESSWRQS
jgi:hypothetical protein